MRSLAIALLIISVLCTLAIALLLKPDYLDNTSFTLAVLWSLFLVTINWVSSVYIFSKTKAAPIFGILPSLSFLLLLYSFGSVGLLLFYWNANEFGYLPTSHWVLQILGFGVIFSIVILQFMAAKTAAVDQPSDLPQKSELIGLLQDMRLTVDISSPRLRDSITEIEDLIRYSVPHPSVVVDQERYRQLGKEISFLSVTDISEAEWMEKIITLRVLVSTIK